MPDTKHMASSENRRSGTLYQAFFTRACRNATSRMVIFNW